MLRIYCRLFLPHAQETVVSFFVVIMSLCLQHQGDQQLQGLLHNTTHRVRSDPAGAELMARGTPQVYPTSSVQSTSVVLQ